LFNTVTDRNIVCSGTRHKIPVTLWETSCKSSSLPVWQNKSNEAIKG